MLDTAGGAMPDEYNAQPEYPESDPGGDPREDRPRRRRDRYRDDYPPDKQVSVIGIFALVQGVVSVLVSLVPCVGAVGIIGGVFGLLLGIIAIVLAKNSGGRVGLGVPVAAVSLNLGGSIIAGLWIALLGGAFTTDKKPGDVNNPVLTVRAVDLDNEYDRGEFEADEKYKGKWIEVTGTVAQVAAGRNPKPALELEADNAAVECVFPIGARADLGSVQARDRIVVRGRCRGKTWTRVVLEDCVLHEREPEKKADPGPEPKLEPAVRVTAAQLDKAFDENVVAADGMYTGKVLEVSGTMHKVLRGEQSGVTLLLRVGGEEAGATIHCDFGAADGLLLAPLKPGDPVVVRGKCLGQNGNGSIALAQCRVAK